MTIQQIDGHKLLNFASHIDDNTIDQADIDIVMADAAGLVEIEHELHQLLNVKGT